MCIIQADGFGTSAQGEARAQRTLLFEQGDRLGPAAPQPWAVQGEEEQGIGHGRQHPEQVRLGVPESSTDWRVTMRRVRPDIVSLAPPASLRRLRGFAWRVPTPATSAVSAVASSVARKSSSPKAMMRSACIRIARLRA
jgi:hypothetical protein